MVEEIWRPNAPCAGDGENQVKSGDLAGVLLNASPKNGSSKTIALSVIEVTGFLVQGERAPRRFLEFDELDSTKTKVIGQVIDLELSGVGAGWDWSGHYWKSLDHSYIHYAPKS